MFQIISLVLFLLIIIETFFFFKYKNNKDLNIDKKDFNKVPYPGIPDSQPNSFKEFILYNNTPRLLKVLYRNLDGESKRILDSSLQKIMHIPDTKFCKYFLMNYKFFATDFKTNNEKFAYLKRIGEVPNIINKYKFPKGFNGFSYIFYSDINLRFSNLKIKNYIENKIFIDGGAFIGDCALVMQKYNPKKIYSFDISKNNIDIYKQTMALNKIPTNKYEINEIALSNKKNIYNISSAELYGSIFESYVKKDTTVESIDIDSFLKNKNGVVGFIHADVQGALCEMIIGMRNTIKKDRPVLSLDISNSPKEFFYAKPILEKIVCNLNYKIKIINYDDDYRGLIGLTIWAYPKELDD